MCNADELDAMCTAALKDDRSATQLVQPYNVFFSLHVTRDLVWKDHYNTIPPCQI